MVAASALAEPLLAPHPVASNLIRLCPLFGLSTAWKTLMRNLPLIGSSTALEYRGSGHSCFCASSFSWLTGLLAAMVGDEM